MCGIYSFFGQIDSLFISPFPLLIEAIPLNDPSATLYLLRLYLSHSFLKPILHLSICYILFLATLFSTVSIPLYAMCLVPCQRSIVG